MNAVGLKSGLTTAMVAACGFAWFQRRRVTNRVVIHMDLNKTMIMSDAIQGLGFKKSLNTILADQACFGTVEEFDASNPLHQKQQSNAINDKVWIPKLLAKDRSWNSPDGLVSFGRFVMESLPYSKDQGVDPQIKSQRNSLRQQFTEDGHPGSEWKEEVDRLFTKLSDHLVMPAFWTLIDYLHQRYQKNKRRTFMVLFRTFGSDLPEVVEVFNRYCSEKGYDELMIDWSDPSSHGVIVHHQGELCLVTGTVEIEPRFQRVTEGMTREMIENVNRLAFYEEMENIEIHRGYDEVYRRMCRGNMAIREDYCWWALHDEKPEYGKVLLMDAFDTNTHHLFFDDCASYVVNARDVNDPETSIKFESIEGIHAVHANSYAVMSDDSYFIDHFYRAEEKFTERKQKWMRSH